jgi:hypothetical protein
MGDFKLDAPGEIIPKRRFSIALAAVEITRDPPQTFKISSNF